MNEKGRRHAYEGHRATRSHLLRCQVTAENRARAEGVKCYYPDHRATRVTLFGGSVPRVSQKRQFPDHPCKQSHFVLG